MTWPLCAFRGPEEELEAYGQHPAGHPDYRIAALRVMQAEREIIPLAAAGHSLGEYGALVASGGLRFADAVRLVHLRGKFMQEAVPVGVGAMAAIMGMTGAEVETLCREAAQGEVLSPANYNSPGQIAIAGHSHRRAESGGHGCQTGGKKSGSTPGERAIPLRLDEAGGRKVERRTGQGGGGGPALSRFSPTPKPIFTREKRRSGSFWSSRWTIPFAGKNACRSSWARGQIWCWKWARERFCPA